MVLEAFLRMCQEEVFRCVRGEGHSVCKATHFCQRSEEQRRAKFLDSNSEYEYPCQWQL